MKKEWYIRMEGQAEGPYSFNDLKLDSRVTPQTYAWRRGMAVWLPISEIPELEGLFLDEPREEEAGQGGENVLTLDPVSPLQPFWFILLAILLILFIFLTLS